MLLGFMAVCVVVIVAIHAWEWRSATRRVNHMEGQLPDDWTQPRR